MAFIRSSAVHWHGLQPGHGVNLVGWMDGWEHTGLHVERICCIPSFLRHPAGTYIHDTTYTPGAIPGTTASNPASSAAWQRLRAESTTFCLLVFFSSLPHDSFSLVGLSAGCVY